MRKWIALSMLVAASCLGAESEWWSKVSVTPFGAVQHPDFGAPQYGAGLDVGYYLNKTLSLHLSNLASEQKDWGGSAIDETSLLFRADLIRDTQDLFAVFVLGSSDHYWGDNAVEGNDWGFGVGVGAELRLSKYTGIGVDSRIRAWFDRDKDLLTRAFINIRF